MKERGVKWIFIGGVDNALLKMADVTLLGMAMWAVNITLQNAKGKYAEVLCPLRRYR